MARSATTSTKGSGAGATMATTYAPRSQTVTVIDVEDLREFQSSMKEEFAGFAFGQFFAAGAFWLAVERYMTEAKPHEDMLLWICVFAFIAGSVIMGFSLRQLSRRKTKIGRIIIDAENSLTTSTTATPVPRTTQ